MKLTAWIEGTRLRPPVEVESAKQVIIRDELGQPVMVLIQHAPDRIWLVKQGDPDFADALAVLGIDSTGADLLLEQVDAGKDIKFPAPKAL